MDSSAYTVDRKVRSQYSRSSCGMANKTLGILGKAVGVNLQRPISNLNSRKPAFIFKSNAMDTKSFFTREASRCSVDGILIGCNDMLYLAYYVIIFDNRNICFSDLECGTECDIFPYATFLIELTKSDDFSIERYFV